MPMLYSQTTRYLPKRLLSAAELIVAGILLAVLGTGLPTLMATPLNWGIAYTFFLLTCLLTLIFWPYGPLGWANRITLVRSVFIAIVAGALATNAFIDAIWLWLIMAVIALLLDGMDGWMARRTQSHSSFGARFDMEMDALLIMLLCMGLLKLEALGLWVLLMGSMRYLFVAASWPFPWLKKPLFISYRRKAVCVWQVVALLLALSPLTSHITATLLALSALASLIYSFGIDIWWLYKQPRLEGLI